MQFAVGLRRKLRSINEKHVSRHISQKRHYTFCCKLWQNRKCIIMFFSSTHIWTGKWQKAENTQRKYVINICREWLAYFFLITSLWTGTFERKSHREGERSDASQRASVKQWRNPFSTVSHIQLLCLYGCSYAKHLHFYLGHWPTPWNTLLNCSFSLQEINTFQKQRNTIQPQGFIFPFTHSFYNMAIATPES